MDFDFNLILVPVTLFFLAIWALDKLVFKARARHRASEVQAAQLRAQVADAEQAVIVAGQAANWPHDPRQPSTDPAEPQPVRAARAEWVRLRSQAANQGGVTQEPAIIRWAYEFWPVLMLVLVVRSFLVEPFNIPSESMAPTLKTGDFILVNKYAFGVRLPLLNTKILDTGRPQHGDVAVFRYPPNPRITYIKRIIGLPGDRISYNRGVISLNGQPLPREAVQLPSFDPAYENLYREQIGTHNHLIRELAGYRDQPIGDITGMRADFLQAVSPVARDTQGHEWSVQVPAGHYFVLGDNRDQSADSRFWGFVPDENLSGKAFYVWMHKQPGLKQRAGIDQDGRSLLDGFNQPLQDGKINWPTLQRNGAIP